MREASSLSAAPTNTLVFLEVLRPHGRLARKDVYPAYVSPEKHHESFLLHTPLQLGSHSGAQIFHFVQGAIQHGNLLQRADRWIDLRKSGHREGGGLKLADAHATNGIFLAAHGAVGVDGEAEGAVGDGSPPLSHLFQHVVLR
jgi:hypothetical protein